MNSGNKHIIAHDWSSMAQYIEQTFFRIEREKRWLAGLVNGIIAGAAVALVSWLVTTLHEGQLLLFACLGSSAASVVFAPISKTNSLRSIIVAYTISSLVCAVLFPIHALHLLPVPLMCFASVSLSVTLMRVLDTMHPAAIGSALAFVIYERDIQSLLMLMLAVIGLLAIVKMLAYVYLEDLEFRTFGKEFHRDYHGHEVTVTVANPPQATSVVVDASPDL